MMSAIVEEKLILFKELEQLNMPVSLAVRLPRTLWIIMIKSLRNSRISGSIAIRETAKPVYYKYV